MLIEALQRLVNEFLLITSRSIFITRDKEKTLKIHPVNKIPFLIFLERSDLSFKRSAGQ